MGGRKGTVEGELVPKDTLQAKGGKRIKSGRFNFSVRKSKPCMSAGTPMV